jgi:hypothetical protein
VWRTCDGERVLQGAEWELFRVGLDEVWDYVEDSFDDDCFHFGIAAFDDLQPGQKLALLAQVGQALHDEAVPPPPLTAHAEATIAAVYVHIRQSVELEIDEHDDVDPEEFAFHWRRLVLSAYRDTSTTGDDPPPGESCDDISEWDLLIDCLSERILWDDDYMTANHFLDAAPEAGHAEMEALGIADDYYVALASDRRDEELEAVRRALREVTGRRVPEGQEVLNGFEDRYHGLFVGPCDPEAIARETECPLIEEVGVAGAENFDCTYQEWSERFREAVLQRAAKWEPTSIVSEFLPSPEQLADAERARQTRRDLALGDGHTIEPRPGGWVVVDESGCCLVEIESCTWSADPDDRDLPPLLFPGPAEALAAFLRSEWLALSRATRREAALRLLGREV